MALSPSVVSNEIDKTLNISSIVSNGTGYVGMFRWGAVDQVTTITTNEAELVKKFGRPDSNTTLYFHSALNYLLYVTPLSIVRVVGTNAKNSVPTGQTAIQIGNDAQYETATLTGISFLGRYPGELGNSIKVSCANSAGFATWAYKSKFDYAPTGSQFNVAVIDVDGYITGIANSVLETYQLVTTTSGSKRTDGTSAYINKVLSDQSNYVLVGDNSEITFDESGSLGVYEVTLQGGADDNDAQNADFDSGWEVFANKQTYDIARTFASGSPSESAGTSIDMCETRQDAIAFIGPDLDSVYNNTDTVTALTTYFGTTINRNSSYGVYVDNWKQVYDKYNDNYIWIPCDSDAAALHARTWQQQAPWWSPAGLTRGVLKNVVKLAWNSNEDDRDVLYPAAINSIVSFMNEGTVLWGDKTSYNAPSAFSRINVRSLFIVLKKNISYAARYQLFEFNDFITRTNFKRASDSYMDTVEAGRGVTDYLTVCDESNNTPDIIDGDGFVGDIYVKPNRSINWVTLNFVAVATGVDFTEVEGTAPVTTT